MPNEIGGTKKAGVHLCYFGIWRPLVRRKRSKTLSCCYIVAKNCPPSHLLPFSTKQCSHLYKIEMKQNVCCVKLIVTITKSGWAGPLDIEGFRMRLDFCSARDSFHIILCVFEENCPLPVLIGWERWYLFGLLLRWRRACPPIDIEEYTEKNV